MSHDPAFPPTTVVNNAKVCVCCVYTCACMSVCVCICMYVCMYVYVCMCVHT